MNKFKLFIENFWIYGMGGMISKAIPFIMMPIITRIMPDSSYYGISEMFNTMMLFASTFVLFGMYDSMFRFFFDNDSDVYKKEICSTALFFTVGNSFIILFLINIFRNKLSILFLGDIAYRYMVSLASLAAIISAFGSMLGAPTKMLNERKKYLLINTIAPAISYLLAVILLLNGQYIVALPVGAMISNIVIAVIFLSLNYKWFSVKSINVCHLKKMMTVALPVVPITLIYWIFNSCDKLMITNMISLEAAGIYSVGAKFGAISQLIYTGFSGGWQYFAYSTMKDEDQKVTNSKIFEYLGVISIVATIALCVVIRFVFGVLFKAEYLMAYIVTPYLFLSPLIQMLFQILCSQYTIHRKTWMNMVFLLLAAGINIVLNFYLIPLLGIEGAALSTLIGYFSAVLISLFIALKLDYIVISRRLTYSFALAIFFFVLWRLVFCEHLLFDFLFAFVIYSVFISFYRKDIKLLYLFIKK